MKKKLVYDGEYRLMRIVWEHEPLGSGELARLCEEQLGWKKSTTYTVLKKLCTRGLLQNEKSIVSARISMEEVHRAESEQLMEKAFGNSLPRFVATFLRDRKLSPQEAEEIRRLIDAYEKE